MITHPEETVASFKRFMGTAKTYRLGERAVSYTHLKGYPCYLNQAGRPAAQYAYVKIYDTGAVSYTHLDVYKRQGKCIYPGKSG